MNHLLNEANAAIKSGNKRIGSQKSHEFLASNPSNESAWLLLESITEDPQQKRNILNQILITNPNSQTTQNRLASLARPSEPIIDLRHLRSNAFKFEFQVRHSIITTGFVVVGVLGGAVFALPFSLYFNIGWEYIVLIGILLGGLLGFIIVNILSFLEIITQGVFHLVSIFQRAYKSRWEKL